MFTARFSFAKSDCGSTVPRKMDLNWFIPALVNSRVGSDRGTTGEEATMIKMTPKSARWFILRGGGLTTKGVAVLLDEIVQKSFSDPRRGPFRTVCIRSHGERNFSQIGVSKVVVVVVVGEDSGLKSAEMSQRQLLQNPRISHRAFPFPLMMNSALVQFAPRPSTQLLIRAIPLENNNKESCGCNTARSAPPRVTLMELNLSSKNSDVYI